MVHKIIFISMVTAAFLFSQSVKTPADYVNPFIGTKDMGHTFPGATVPFGMVQLSPETDTVLFTYGKEYNSEVYRYCSGYQYDDNTIVGFSHTHFNGTGHSDLGDFLIMPTVGELQINPGTKDDPDSGYRSRYSHQTEEAYQGYIEGNAWNYSLYVPHDVQGFIYLLGSKEKLISWIDSLFTMNIPDESFAHSEDIDRAGMIGNYVHGNEPSHQVPYMYCYAGAPWKTQEKIHQIVNTMYKNKPDGLSGNDDCGQMSAWYIFSVLGFYPVAPGSNEYVIGSPCMERAVINLENGNHFKIETENYSKKNIYIKEIYLNGESLNRTFIEHEEIINGGTLRFVMSSIPNKEWGSDELFYPYSLTK